MSYEKNRVKKTLLCKDCQNMVYEKNSKVSCDYNYFDGVHVYKAYIYIPEMFDCIEWEKRKE
jgi:hypothetical protein